VGRIPLVQGWKAVYSASEPDAASDETEQTLPPLTDGEMVRLTEPRVEAKRTQAPPRYNEGTLIDAMQNAWRFVEDLGVRERLKEAKGIGTPATRAEIIKGLRKQNLLAADGKWVVPTSAGLQLFELLRAAAPALVDPGTTAEWEMQLDAVVTGKADHRRVIDAIAVEAEKLIGVLQKRECGAVNLSAAPVKPEPRKRRSRRAAAAKDETASAKPTRRRAAASAKPKRPHRGRAHEARSAPETSAGVRAAPTDRMVAYAEKLAKTKKLPLPPGYAKDFQACRRFLDQHG
jgi:DNA topoisomerase-3